MKHFLLILSAALSIVSAKAQDAFDKMVYCTGTTAQSGPDHWAYILFQPVKLDLLDGKTLAVYQQSGNSGPFALKSVITGPQSDPSVIKPLLARSLPLGQDLAQLESSITAMFQDAVPDPAIPLERKLSAVIQGTIKDPAKRQNLFLLARQHPAMALILGQGAALKLPNTGSFTMEVRLRSAAGQDEAVLGRVILNTAAPLVLPAPGQPFHVTDKTPRGHLHAQLRWATPDTLRQLSLSQYGFNVYRMTDAFVLSRGYQNNAPSRAQLTADVAAANAIRINRLPVLADRDYDAASVADPANTTFFIADDNKVFNGGTAFVDASNHWYFATARDILGRDGAVSQGRKVTMCDRIAPLPPTNLAVTSETTFAAGASKQWLRAKWNTPETNDASGFLKYYIYRWTNPDQIAVNQRTLDPAPAAANPALIGTVNHVAGTTSYSFDDTGLPGSPVQPANNGITFWYTVRAVDDSSCQNVSGNSTPQFGVLRDREGPPAASGDVLITCYSPAATFRSASLINNPTADQSRSQIHANLLAEATTPGLDEKATAEFWYGSTLLGIVAFKMEPGATALRARLLHDFDPTLSSIREINCYIRTGSGKRSAIAFMAGQLAPTNNATQTASIVFDASVSTVNQPASTANECGNQHEPSNPASDEPNYPHVVFAPPLTSREYKIFRRVDDGDLSLVKQGTYPAGTLAPQTIPDDAVPATAAEICYYVQCFDEHGNPSPMALLGCIENCAPLQAPMLATIEATGNSASPKMKLRWFCPPAGITRFEIFLHRASGDYTLANAGLSSDKAAHPNFQPFNSTQTTFDFSIFETASLQSLAAVQSAEHSVELPCSIGDVSRVMIRAVGKGDFNNRCVGPLSNGEEFSWTGSVASTAVDVPWPARPLPPKDSAAFPGLTPVWLNPKRATLGVGLPIGQFTMSDRTWLTPPALGPNNEVPQTIIPATGSVASTLRKNADLAAKESGPFAGSLLPCVLFRYQVPNTKYPAVSGDVVQVSPMLEDIAHQTTAYPSSNGGTAQAHVVKDPFVAGVDLDPLEPEAVTVLALDRQPVVRGAEYKYLFVRFKGRTKEIDRIIPATGSITIP
jgi:hypothetical protein